MLITFLELCKENCQRLVMFIFIEYTCLKPFRFIQNNLLTCSTDFYMLKYIKVVIKIMILCFQWFFNQPTFIWDVSFMSDLYTNHHDHLTNFLS